MELLELHSPHWEALTDKTLQAFRLVAKLNLIQRFYLAGGTGLALHLGHRFSVDLDFFSQEPDSVGPEERAQLHEALDDPNLTITYDKDTTFMATWQNVGISFFRLQQYPLVRPVFRLENVLVASIEEIGAMKLAAIIDRGTRKDLVDLFFILQRTSLEELFRVAAMKYAKVRTFAVSATRALAYFEDAEALPMPRMLDRTPWRKMKTFLEHQAMQAGRKHLEDLWT
jgi:predicted nucleotidyltransferase component of viral defense system